MAMDWSAFVGYMTEPPEDDVDDENFYSFGPNIVNSNDHMQTTAGASSTDKLDAKLSPATDAMQSNGNDPMTPSAADDQKKVEQQKQLETLRKKLLAKRANSARSETPSKTTKGSVTPQVQAQPNVEQQGKMKFMHAENEQSSDEYGIISLLAEGKAAAEQKVARDKQAAAAALIAATPDPAETKSQRVPSTGPALVDVDHGQLSSSNTGSAGPTQSNNKTPPRPTDITTVNSNATAHPVNLSDPYYEDLAVWLEFTGYHDVQFRNAKLSTYKERRELEKEAARIAERLEKLKEVERTDLESLRATSAHPTPASQMAPPPLPSTMPPGDTRQGTGNLKRPHSPDSIAHAKASRSFTDSGYKFRGANELMGASRDVNSSSQRRHSYSKPRRSHDERQQRDPSLERRSSYHNFDIGPRGDNNTRGDHTEWPSSREPPRRFNTCEREREPSLGFGSVNHAGGASNHNGPARLDLHKGGVRYFMIKSWNHENVSQAMEDSLWATQEKNERLLTDAFHTSRHVILLFSVNRSMAFQGYALMTSPPTPSLPLPTFCSKLNWATSAAFSLRWLATAPVHFRNVGHLKNTCNPDESGSPRAVLVGKDGQEISQDAGMGVVEILEVEERIERERERGRG